MVFSFCSIQLYIPNMDFPFALCIMTHFGRCGTGELSREAVNLSVQEKNALREVISMVNSFGQSQYDQDLQKQTFRLDCLPGVVRTDRSEHLLEPEDAAVKISLRQKFYYNATDTTTLQILIGQNNYFCNCKLMSLTVSFTVLRRL